MLKYPNINYCWGSLMVEELLRCGAEYFCLSPGSRCSPLSVSAARHKKAKTIVHFDERGLGFHAMGYAAASHKIPVLICTSGTAVANFLPAVVEASKKKLPLIILSADRPPELRLTGALQTIDQVNIFGKYSVWQTDMPCPDEAISPRFVLTTMDQAFYQAKRHKGVVHINCMFREPLEELKDKTKWSAYLHDLKDWERSKKPYTEYTGALYKGIANDKAIASRICAIKNGIVVAGKLSCDQERNRVLHFARCLGWPIFADISSGLRLGEKAPEVISYFDHILGSDKLRRRIKPDGIIHFGGRMTSKRYYEFIAQDNVSAYVMVLDHALRNDPLHKVTLRLETSVSNFCDNISPLLKPRAKSALLKDLIAVNMKIDGNIERSLKAQGRLSEPLAARLVSQLIGHGQGLYLSNSMPIRDMDMYADFKGHAVRAAGNRGASGIDGLVASAAGFAQGLKAPVTLMAGDLALLHDLNSLAMLKDIDQPLVIVVLNNGGGGIFSFLPIASCGDVFEKIYGTPHPFSFANAAGMFELNYAQPRTAGDFKKAYETALKSGTSSIIELMSNREENLNLHRIVSKQAIAM